MTYAVLVIDMEMQSKHFREFYKENRDVVDRQVKVIELAGQLSLPVINMSFSGYFEAETLPHIRRAVEDARGISMEKKMQDAFAGTDHYPDEGLLFPPDPHISLDDYLIEMGKPDIIAIGQESDVCALKTIRSGLRRGYGVVSSMDLLIGNEKRFLNRKPERLTLFTNYMDILELMVNGQTGRVVNAN